MVSCRFFIVGVLLLFAPNIKCIFQTFSFLNSDYNIRSIKTFKTLKTFKSYVTFNKTKEGEIYLIKQMIHIKLGRQFTRIKEALGSCIAQSAAIIPMNIVNIISPDIYVPGKTFPKRTATIHTFVPGSLVSSLRAFRNITIKQFKKNSAKSADWGLSRAVIRSMSIHPDLAIIVAFDTFIGNRDRCNKNVIFNKKTKRFYGIDLDISFKTYLSELACQKVQVYLMHRASFNFREISALKKYRDILIMLLQKNPPELLHQALDSLSLQAGFDPKINKSKKIAKTKKWITNNYIHVCKLVELLNRIVGRYTLI